MHCHLPIARLAASLAALLPAFTTTAADTAAPDKSRYTLFNPTPRQFLRDMSTDRPDQTESAYTVDAGHFQIEMDLVNYTYDRYEPTLTDVRTTSISVMPMNLKVGLCNRADLQLIVQPHTRVRTDDRSTGTVTKQSGFDDLITRLKVNLWGNDGGKTALAVMPFVKLPANQNNIGNRYVEGGVIVPLAVELPAGWGMGLMTEIDIIRDTTGAGYHPEFVNSVTFAHDIFGKLGGYVEFFTVASTEAGSDWQGFADFGFTYALTDNLQFDAGANFGITRPAPDVNPFLGISWRF